MERKHIIALIIVALILAVVFIGSRSSNTQVTRESTHATTSSEAVEAATSTVINTNTHTMNFKHQITLQTNKGTIVFETYDNDAPNTVNNFITLSQKGFYDNLIFHRVIKDFMIQGGDPLGNGTGGPGYAFNDELTPGTESAQKGYVRGAVAMANAGPNTNGSQFFIMHKDYPLPHNYTIFGQVVSGIEVVDAIASVATGASDRPVEPVVIQKVTVTTK